MSKDEDGNVTIREIEEINPEHLNLFSPIVSEVTGLLSQGDIEAIGSLLDTNSSAALILWENTWAARFAQAVANANGQVVARETVPYELVQAALDAKGAAAPTAD